MTTAVAKEVETVANVHVCHKCGRRHPRRDNSGGRVLAITCGCGVTVFPYSMQSDLVEEELRMRHMTTLYAVSKSERYNPRKKKRRPRRGKSSTATNRQGGRQGDEAKGPRRPQSVAG